MTRRHSFLILVGVGAFVAGVALWSQFPTLDAEILATRVRAAGALGPVVLFAWFVVQCVVVPLPSEPMMMAAGFVYGVRLAFTIAWVGVVMGAAACFGLARTFGRSFVERFVRSEHLDALDAYVGNRGLAATFAVVLGLRLFAFTSFDVLSYGCGLVRFPFGWFLVATAFGAVPKVFAFTYAGASVGLRPGWLGGVMLAGTLGVLVVLPWLASRGRRSVDQDRT
jgi:uncharacterized membrane protein YdjX (TVP38/TMEM64 family)